VCGTEAGQPTRQFTVYQNKVTVTTLSNKENFMCLPIPLKVQKKRQERGREKGREKGMN
jgi:hypothetical protein